MKINLDQPLVHPLSGVQLKDPENPEVPLTLKWSCTHALLFGSMDGLSGNEKIIRYEMALRIHKGGTQELTVEDLAKLKEYIGKSLSTIIVGQVLPMLDGKQNG